MEINEKQKKKIAKLVNMYIWDSGCNIIKREDIETATMYFIEHPELWKDVDE